MYFLSQAADSTFSMILNGLLSKFLTLLNGSIIAMVDVSFLLSFQITFKERKMFYFRSFNVLVSHVEWRECVVVCSP